MTSFSSPRHRRIQAYIRDDHRPEMLALLKRLTEIESHSDYREGVNAVGEVIAGELEKIGFSIQKYPDDHYGDCVVADQKGLENKRVLLVGHLDTVYPVGSGWPFTVENDRVFGPGVLDMKSGIVSLLYALKALQETGGLPCHIRVFLNGDEEPGSPKSRPLLPKVVEEVDYALVFEPAEKDGVIVTERKGVAIFTVSITGRAAHAGQEPEKGIKANLELAHQVIYAENLAKPELGTTVNAGLIKGGTAAYVISEQAEAKIDVRVTNIEEQHRIEAGIQKMAHLNQVAGTTIDIKGGFHRPPMIVLPRAQALIEAVRLASTECNMPVSFGLSGAASDANNLTAMGIPTLDGMGPVGGRAHSHEEYLDLESLYERTVRSAILLTRLVDQPKNTERQPL
jgi:glutamate carboxypeptidase